MAIYMVVNIKSYNSGGLYHVLGLLGRDESQAALHSNLSVR